MKLLAIDTATEACSVALLSASGIAERYEVAPRRHTELVLPWVEALLADAGLDLSELDALAVTRGPGSFTGVRIGLSVAQGLAVGAGLPVVPVSTLEAMALAVHRDSGAERVLAALDARMGQVYCGGYRFGPPTREAVSERVCGPRAVELPDAGWCGVGPAFQRYPELQESLGAALEAVVAGPGYPRASRVAEIARQRLEAGEGAMAPEQVRPVYLRDEVARKPGAP